MLDFTESMIKSVFKKVNNSTIIDFGKNKISLKNKFKVIDFFESIKKFSKRDVSGMDSKALNKFLKDSKIKIEKNANYNNLIDKVFSHFVEPNLIQPTFIVNFPKEISPLAKTHRENDNLVERFELFIQGMEVANAYTELNDPDLQQQLFTTQLAGQAEEDSMAKMDHDFIRALQHGMPPAGGLGIGIDRLVMLLTGSQSIREVILFPLLRPEDD